MRSNLTRALLLVAALSSLLAILSSLSQRPDVSAQINCPALEPVVTGTDPLRSRNAWPKNAQIKVYILNDASKDNSYQFTDSEVQAVEAVFRSWESPLRICSGIKYLRLHCCRHI